VLAFLIEGRIKLVDKNITNFIGLAPEMEEKRGFVEKTTEK